MKTAEERAMVYEPDAFDADEIFPAREGYIVNRVRRAYIAGAIEQKTIDIKTIRDLHCSKCGFPTHCDLCEIGQILKVLERE